MDAFNLEKLIEYAILYLEKGNIPDNYWNIGGGTILAEIYNHRISKDIDVFVEDIQLLGGLSPRVTDEMDSILYYEEMNKYIKFVFPEGKIDFIAAPNITSFKATLRNFHGFRVPVSDPVEIVMKKIFFRGNKIYPRDIFDLSVVYESDRKKDLVQEALKMPDKIDMFHKALSEEIKNKSFRPYIQICPELILKNGIKVAGREIEICKMFINQVKLQQKLKDRKTNKLKGRSR
jgi:predicted nucleotidyltransferase component of viral defense system